MMDAPYIREAETLGVPPYDEPDVSGIVKELQKAEKEIDGITDLIISAEDDLLALGIEPELRELLYEIEQAGINVRKAWQALSA